MSLLNALVRNNDQISGVHRRVKPIKMPDAEYDFIVVGGGAAGSVVAARLSDIKKWKVLLIEAGPDEPACAGIPSFAASFLRTKIDWNYTTTNERNACLSTNGSCSWPSGKNLGGSTTHNHMVYLRGNAKDYDNWAKQKNKGWSWKYVKKYFMSSEDNGEIKRVGRKHHATGGPLPVERFRYVPKFAYSVLAAAKEKGYGVSEDLNGDVITGVTIAQATTKNGVRLSSAAAFLWPVRNRKNLHISLNSFVTKVIIKDGRAVGVEYHKDGKLRIVKAIREVVLCAGSVRSPHLLLLSGVGPKKHLESVGVKVVTDLPGVGENLQDHVALEIGFTINGTNVYDNSWAAAMEYITSQTGPMSGTGLPQIVATLASNATTPDYPDTQIFVHGYIAGCAPGNTNARRSSGPRDINMLPTILHPQSRGKVSLASEDPHHDPLICANYFDESTTDLQRLVEAIKMALALSNTTAMRAHNLTLKNTPVKSCSHHTFASDQYWACAARENTLPQRHQAGSCKMGPASDPMAVVDPRLRVHKLEGLRIADASIMPTITSSNTAAPTIMIGEKAADMIKKDWKKDRTC